jgi:hypothetical protein
LNELWSVCWHFVRVFGKRADWHCTNVEKQMLDEVMIKTRLVKKQIDIGLLVFDDKD